MISATCVITQYNILPLHIFSSAHITSINIPINAKNDLKMPSWGIVSNTGNIEFSKYGADTIVNLVKQGRIQKGDLAQVILENENASAEIYNGVVKSIGNNGKNLEITDGLEEWQNRPVPQRDYNWESPSATAKDVYDYLRQFSWQMENTEENIIMPSFTQLDSKTQNILATTRIPNYFLESDNLWGQYNKLCNLCMCYIYKQGKTAKFEYKGGK